MNPRRVLLDCDPGTDDAIAILLALASPELEVALITVSGGNVPLARTLANALALAALAGARLPVHAGQAQALLGPYPPGWPGHGENGLAGVLLAPGGAPAPGHGPDAIRGAIRCSPRPLTLIGIGPATNLALALATEPELVGNVEEIVLMSGARGAGNTTPFAEFNAFSDPEALAIVLGAGARVTLATLETGRGLLLTPARLSLIRAAGGGTAAAKAAAILGALLRNRDSGVPLYDPAAVAWLIAPELFSARPAEVTLEVGRGARRGETVIEDRTEGRVRVLEPRDPDRLFALLAERLARLP